MKKVNKIVSGVLSISLIAALSACDATPTGGSDTGATTTKADDTTSAAVTTTSASTVEINTTEFADEQLTVIQEAMKALPDIELANKEIKWLAHYDVNPSATTGAAKSPQQQMFEDKYGGSIKWIETTWGTRFADLAAKALAGEGVDAWAGDDEANFPKTFVNGQIQAVNQYVNFDDPIWASVQQGVDTLTYAGQVVAIPTGVNARHVLVYNKETIDANGLEDPYEQWKNGEWNWDTFKASLLDFVDTENDQWGLDGYWYERALVASTGKPYIGTDPVTGLAVSNMDTPEMAAVAELGYELWSNGLVCDRATTEGQLQPARMGDGRELFWIAGAYEVTQVPQQWPTQIPPESLGMVPVPSPAGSATTYVNSRVDGFAILKGASNPEGVVAYAMCGIVNATDPNLIEIVDEQYRRDFQLSDEVIQANKDINALAAANPVLELAAGIDDIATEGSVGWLTSADYGDDRGMRAAFHGIPWATTRESSGTQIQTLLDEFNIQFQAALDAAAAGN
jgi:hypothetical protein